MDFRKPIGFIGGGNMAEALAGGFIQAGLAQPQEIIVAEPRSERADYLKVHYGVRVTSDNQEAARHAGTLFLAVKPQVLPQALAQLGATLRKDQLVVSIAAGIPLSLLEKALPSVPVIRAMPNTPALIGSSATAISPGGEVRPDMTEWARTLFESVGICEVLPEKHMDAVTGLSGSGPAYLFLMAEALTDGGVLMGLPREEAARLAYQTILGAARMLLETGKHPGTLKDMVTSPGGTTIAGIRVLEDAGFRSAVIHAVEAAAERSRELGED